MNAKAIHILRVWEWRLLVVLIYVLPIHEASKNIVWGILVMVWLVRQGMERNWPHVGGLGWATMFWFFAGLWATFFAIEPYASWRGVWDMARAGILLWVVASHAHQDSSRLAVLRHLVLSTGLASAIAWIDLSRAIHGMDSLAYLRIGLRSVGHFNQSAIYLGMAWMLSLAVLIDGQTFARRWLGGTATALIGFALLGTTSRTANLFALLGSLILLWKFKRPRWVLRGLLVGGLFMALLLVGSGGVRGRILFRGSFSNRVVGWKAAWEAVRNRPWTGVGLNNFQNLYLKSADPKHFTLDHAHNLYLTTLAQMGIPGILALGGLLGSAALALWRCRPLGWGGSSSGLCFFALGGVWWIIAFVGIGNTTLHHELSMFFFIAMGLLPYPKSVAGGFQGGRISAHDFDQLAEAAP